MPPSDSTTVIAPVAATAARVVARPSVGEWLRMAPRSVWVLFDQGMVSLTNFAASVAVARFAGGEQLGLYFLGFGGLMLAHSVAKALVWTPYTAAVPHKSDAAKATFTGSATFFAVAVGLIGSVVALLAAAGCWWLSPASFFPGVLAAVALAAPFWLLREHVRRVCLAELRIGEVLLFDIAACAIQLAAIGLLLVSDQLTGATALLTVAAPALAGFVWLAIRRRRVSISLAQVKRDGAETWPFAKWLGGGAASVQAGEQGMRWLMPGLHGLMATGQLAAGQQIIQLANPLVLGVSNYLGPSSANVYGEGGLAGLWRHTVRGTYWLVLCGSVATAGLVTLGPLFARLVFGADFEQVDPLLILSLALGVFSTAAHLPIEFASVARSRGKLMFWTAILRLTINATVGVCLVWLLGPMGVGLGLLAGNSASLAVQWTALAREVRHA
ncbi:MAG: hypothetical protein AAGJ46_02995 [Planctomycetota bacterium]